MEKIMITESHPYKHYIIKTKNVDKLKLRDQINMGIKEYLEAGKKIEVLPKGPESKTLTVGLKDCIWEERAGVADFFDNSVDVEELANDLEQYL